ncbi:MAG: Rrf2 family transcriptional regulator [Acidobacteriota bacterium]
MNSQLAIALHILGFLTSQKGSALTSDRLAVTYGTNPVVIRRVLSKLKAAGLVETRRGAGGGSVLARDPTQITLRHAYEATASTVKVLGRHNAQGEGRIAAALAAFINERYEDAEEALLQKLEAVTIAEMDEQIRRQLGLLDPAACLDRCD